MNDRVRAFIGAPLSDAALSVVVDFQSRLRAEAELLGLVVRWSVPQQLHLTLKFLGNIERRLAEDLATIIAFRASEQSSIDSTLIHPGTFGAPETARTLLLRMTDPNGVLGALAEKFDADAAALGVPSGSRTFVPHVTLGRLSRATNVGRLLLVPFAATIATFSAIRLYESHLGDRGSRYTVLSEARLLSP